MSGNARNHEKVSGGVRCHGPPHPTRQTHIKKNASELARSSFCFDFEAFALCVLWTQTSLGSDRDWNVRPQAGQFIGYLGPGKQAGDVATFTSTSVKAH